MKKIKLLVFIFALVVGLIFAKLFGFSLGIGFPNISFSSKVNGSGVKVTENRDLKNFTKVEISGALEVQLTGQSDFAVSVETDDNIAPLITTEVVGDTLRVFPKDRFSVSPRPIIKVSMGDLSNLDISGASVANVSNIKGNSLYLNASGASKINIAGEVTELNAEASGASKIQAENLKAARVDANASGASKTSVFATEELTARASGASKVKYSGTVTVVNKDVSGASSVSPE